MNKTSNGLELQIWKEIADTHLSISHDHWHVDRVLHYARELHKIYGGDWDIILAAVIMHDLGRSDEENAHGKSSREVSAKKAEKILQLIKFPPEKLLAVKKAILEHDQLEQPSTVEGKILKDADFLAGFGAWGIVRIALWTGESKRRIPILLKKLTEDMPERLKSVEFPETAQLGRRELLFTNLFVQELLRIPDITPKREKGLYIVLEGISGSGKGTQARILEKRFCELTTEVEMVKEPNDNYRAFRDAWQKKHGVSLKDPTVMKFLLMADRYQLMEEKVKPALKQNKVVISDRSFISTLVYQCESEYDIAVTAFDHRFSILPDIFILLDVDPELAWNRIQTRSKKRGLYENPSFLSFHRNRYLQIAEKMFGDLLVVIDANSEIDVVADEIWKSVVQRGLLAKIKG